MWGWRSSSTGARPWDDEPPTGSMTPTETGRNAQRWPRLDWAEPPSPDTAPGRHTAERWAWRVGTRTPRSRTSSPHRVHGSTSVTVTKLAGGLRASSPTIALTAPRVSSWNSLTGDIRLNQLFKIIHLMGLYYIILYYIGSIFGIVITLQYYFQVTFTALSTFFV